jgi:hypothetical protein
VTGWERGQQSAAATGPRGTTVLRIPYLRDGRRSATVLVFRKNNLLRVHRSTPR